jgi:hypothetical protein
VSIILAFPRGCEDFVTSVPDSRSVVIPTRSPDRRIVAVEGCCIDESFTSIWTPVALEWEIEVSRVLEFEVVVPVATEWLLLLVLVLVVTLEKMDRFGGRMLRDGVVKGRLPSPK